MNGLRLYFKTLTNLRSVNYEGQRYIKRWVAPTHVEITRRKKRLPPQPEPKRSNFVEWNRDAEIFAFNERLKEKFEVNKLEEALTHKSYILQEEHRQREIGISDPKLDIQHNEALIKSGKEFTSEVIKTYLSESLPRVPHSGIMAFHDYLMSEKILATASSHIGTKELILTAEHPVSNETLANTFLALVAALAECVDVNHATKFVRDFLIVGLAEKDLSEIWCLSEPLKVLNSILSKENRPLVEPRIIAQAGKNTLLSAYHIAVYSDKQFLGSGFGQTIQEAKETAATNALCRKFGLLDSSPPIRFDKEIDMSV